MVAIRREMGRMPAGLVSSGRSAAWWPGVRYRGWNRPTQRTWCGATRAFRAGETHNAEWHPKCSGRDHVERADRTLHQPQGRSTRGGRPADQGPPRVAHRAARRFVCEDVEAGERWRDVIEKNISRTKLLLVLWPGPDADVKWIQAEIEYFTAKCRKGRLVVLKAPGDPLPGFLSEVQVVDTTRDDLVSDFWRPSTGTPSSRGAGPPSTAGFCKTTSNAMPRRSRMPCAVSFTRSRSSTESH